MSPDGYARMLAHLLASDGWDVDFYGPSMPVRHSADATRAVSLVRSLEDAAK
jgi:hypothetical protein